MSQFGLPDPNDNVLEERIKWDSISNREQKRGSSTNKRGSRTNKIIFISRDSRRISVGYI